MKLKKQLSRMIAAAMCATMVASAIPTNLSINVMAASSSSVTESTTVMMEEPRMNYIENGDFEEVTESGIFIKTLTGFSSWTETNDKSGEDRVGSSNSGNIHNGSYSLRVVGRGDDVYQMVEVIPGATYELTGYVYLTAADDTNTQEGDGIFYIKGYSQNQVSDTYMTFNTGELQFSKYKVNGIKLEDDTLTRGAWMKFTYTVEAPQDTPYLCVYLGGQSRSVYYDDISLNAVFSDVAVKNESGYYDVTPLSKYEISGNVDFGSGADDVLPYWTEAGTTSKLYPTNAQVYEGNGEYSLYINGSAQSASQMIAVEPGKTYELTGYVYLNSGQLTLGYQGYQDADKVTATTTELNTNLAANTAHAKLTYTDPDAETEAPTLLTLGDWYKFLHTVTVDENTKYLDVILTGKNGGYYDNISLCEVVTGSEATPGKNLVSNGGFEGTHAEIKWEGYNASGEATTDGKLGLNEAGYFSQVIDVNENTYRLELSFTDSSGTAAFTDVAVRRVTEPDRFGLSLNSNSYYTAETTAIATLTPNTTAYEITDDWKVNWQVLHDEEVICEGKDVVLSQTEDDGDWMDGEVEISFSLDGCGTKDNVFKATLYVSGVEKETEVWYFDKQYERPSVLNDEGIFVEDGEMFHPVFAYHMITSKTTTADIDDCIDRLGINLFQFNKGFVDETKWETAKTYLDYLKNEGAKVLVCLYTDTIWSESKKQETVKKYMEAFINEDGYFHEYEDIIFAWYMYDEPVGGGVSEDSITKTYEMIRDIDPTRPVYVIDQREKTYPTLIRNADAVTIDNYPYGKWDAMTYIYDSAKYAVETAATSNKPVYTLLQCFENLSGAFINPELATGTLYMPSANAIRNMIYQSLMAGTKGFGYYGFDYGPGTDNDGYNYDTSGYIQVDTANGGINVRQSSDLVKGIAEYASKEQQMMFEYFVEDKYPTFNVNYDYPVEGTKGIRYESFLKDGKVYMIILNKEEYAEQTVSVPLTGKDAKGNEVTITGFTAEAYAGMLDTSGEAITTEAISSDGGTLNVTLQPGAAVVYAITPKNSVTDITLDQTELSMYVDDEATLKATVIPSDATFPTLSWESDNTAVATVDANGKVTAVGLGTATITVSSSNGIQETCTVTVDPVASVDGVNYGTLQQAIEAAEAAETGAQLQLVDNVDIGTENIILTNNGITFDLNGKTLTAGYFAALDGTNVIDSSDNKTGLLKVTVGNLILPESNTQMPVYNGTDGYVFANVKHQEKRMSYVGADTFELVFRPSFGTGTTAKNSLLANGGEAAQIIIGIHLEWIANGEPQTADIKYKDDAEYSMIVDAYTNNKAFYIKASGTSEFQNLTITPYVESNTGVICTGTNFASNVDKDYNIGVWEGEINPDWE